MQDVSYLSNQVICDVRIKLTFRMNGVFLRGKSTRDFWIAFWAHYLVEFDLQVQVYLWYNPAVVD